MPRVTRRKKLRREGYNKHQIGQLTHGAPCSPMAAFGCLHKGMADMVAMRAAWEDLRDELLPQWIADNPFTRPMGWLLFDATEPRIRVVCEQALEAKEVAEQLKKRGDFRHCYFKSLNVRLDAEDTRGDESAFETEKQYLARLGTLTPAELVAVDA